jgi:hypothetical protein
MRDHVFGLPGGKIAMLFAPVLDSFDQPDLGIGCKEPA